MITYELAQKIKDAGFTQFSFDALKPLKGHYEFSGRFIHDMDWDGIKEWDSIERNKIAYIPTLSELIAACGDKFQYLCRHADGWAATGWDMNGERIIKQASAASADEAVASLWLALNAE